MQTLTNHLPFLIMLLFSACFVVLLILCTRVGPYLRELADKNSRLLGCLIEIEWRYGVCLFCGAKREYDHYPDCRYRTLIFKGGKTNGTKKTD